MVKGQLKLGRWTVKTDQLYTVNPDVDAVKTMHRASNRKGKDADLQSYSFDLICKRACGKRVKLTNLFKAAETGKVSWKEGSKEYETYVPLEALGTQATSMHQRSPAVAHNATVQQQRPGLRRAPTLTCSRSRASKSSNATFAATQTMPTTSCTSAGQAAQKTPAAANRVTFRQTDIRGSSSLRKSVT